MLSTAQRPAGRHGRVHLTTFVGLMTFVLAVEAVAFVNLSFDIDMPLSLEKRNTTIVVGIKRSIWAFDDRCGMQNLQRRGV
ncbi:MAG: hypothetical protein ACTS4V_00620 [Candidatus Hodgkinia cicadicola]